MKNTQPTNANVMQEIKRERPQQTNKQNSNSKQVNETNKKIGKKNNTTTRNNAVGKLQPDSIAMRRVTRRCVVRDEERSIKLNNLNID